MTRPVPDRAELAAAIARLLPRVEKPTRYLGGEVNSVVKPAAECHTRVALAFPDLYEIGMSHLGFRILYGLLNAQEGVAAERAFMPWTDMLALLREQGLPLTSLETTTPLGAFDLLGFSLQYELTITNVLAMLDLGGIPRRAADRGEDDPLVLAGGPVVFNAEPFAPFFDLVLAGDAEEALPEMIALRRSLRAQGAGRADVIRAIARLEGWYAPGLYDAVPEPKCGLLVPRPKAGEDVPPRVKRRILMDLDRYPFPADIVVPHGEIVHDRVSWEVMRGCPVGCRFCQAGYIYRPTRERNPAHVAQGVRDSVAATGYDEFSLTSLNTGEYGAIEPLITTLMDEMAPKHVSVGLSSLHATTLTETLIEQVKRVRKTGFTMAPEAGSQRMRDVINKNLTEEDILRAARLAFEGGWELIKLYFMIGLPTETMDDVDALVDLANRIAKLGREIAGPRARVTLSASTFIPKVFTPFQWCGMDSAEAFAAKQDRIGRRVGKGVQFRHHDRESSWLEGALSRADRRAADVIEDAYRRGAVFDGWSECLDIEAWKAAFAAAGLDADDLATRPLPTDVELPWEVIDPVVRKPWLVREHERAHRAVVGTIEPCATDHCSGCAPFAKECLHGVIAENRWSTLPSLPAADPVATVGAGLGAAGAVTRPGPSELGPHDETGDAAATSAAALGAAAEPAPEPPPRPVYRYRGRFEKLGRSRFLGHLDLVRALTMALRRAGIELAYSQGFKPLPRISLSPALALGIGSHGEYFDVDTHVPFGDELIPRVNATLPEGLALTAVVPVDLHVQALQDAIARAQYRATVPGVEPRELERRAREFSDSASWPLVRIRKGRERTLDIRPLVDEVTVEADGTLRFTIVMTKEGAARPSEVLGVLAGPAAEDATIERVALLAARGGRFVSPLLVGRHAVPAASM